MERITHARVNKVDYQHFFSNVILGALWPLGGQIIGYQIFYLTFQYFSFPKTLPFIYAFIVLEFTTFYLHKMYHRFDFLWRIHSVHHSNPIFEVSGALRFHPIELFIHFLVTSVACLIFRISWEHKLLFDMILGVTGMFHHSNLNISPKLHHFLSKFFVTPHYHQFHHAVDSKFHNKNFCSIFNYWDRIFRSYNYLPNEEIKNFGLEDVKVENDLLSLLELPFKN